MTDAGVDDRLFVLRARWLLEDHPWVARAVCDASRGPGPDGTDELRILVHDPAGKEPGIRTMAAVLGLEPNRAASDRSPLQVRTFEDAGRSLRLIVIDAAAADRALDDDREVL